MDEGVPACDGCLNCEPDHQPDSDESDSFSHQIYSDDSDIFSHYSDEDNDY